MILFLKFLVQYQRAAKSSDSRSSAASVRLWLSRPLSVLPGCIWSLPADLGKPQSHVQGIREGSMNSLKQSTWKGTWLQASPEQT